MKKYRVGKNLPPWIGEDAHQLATENRRILQKLSREPILLTGCTGFFGVWILGTLRAAWEKFHFRFDLTIVTRDRNKFLRENPEFRGLPGWRFLEGNIISIKFPRRNFGYILHGAATSARETFEGEPPFKKFQTVFEGTRNLLKHCVKFPPKNLLYLSSGAVYDERSRPFRETDPCTFPNEFEVRTAWKTSKIMAEKLCEIYGRTFKFSVKIARCFSFYGPGLPINLHYAIGNFLRDAINNKNLVIASCGKAQRSYLYITDAVRYIFLLLQENQIRGKYNLGSSKPTTILKLAKKILKTAKLNNTIIIKNQKEKNYSSHLNYLPDIKKIQKTFPAKKETSLNTGLQKTLNWIY